MAADPITSLALAPDGTSVVAGSCGGIVEYSLPDMHRVRHLNTELDAIHDLRFSSDGTCLALAGGTPGEYGLAELVSWPAGDIVSRIRGHDDVIFGVDFSPDQEYLATASLDGRVHVSRVSSGAVVCTIDGHAQGVTGVTWMPTSPNQPDGSRRSVLLTSSLDQTLRMWSVENPAAESPPSPVLAGRLIQTMNQHTAAVTGLAIRPRKENSEPVVVASWGDDRTVRFWQPETGRMLRFGRAESPVSAAVWSADGTRVYVALESGTVGEVSLITARINALQKRCIPIRSLVLAPATGDLIAGDAFGESFPLNVDCAAQASGQTTGANENPCSFSSARNQKCGIIPACPEINVVLAHHPNWLTIPVILTTQLNRRFDQ